MIEPTIAEKPEMTFVGLEASFNHALSKDSTAAQVIGPLWDRFCGLSEAVPHRTGSAMYGIIYGRLEAQRKHPDELQYIAAVQVSSADKLPVGMVARTIPAATYAVFLHRGPIEGIAATVCEIYRVWLPQSAYKHANIADIELYDSRFHCEGPDSEMEYWISIEPKGHA